MKYKKKIKFSLFVLLISLIFELLVVVSVGIYLYKRVDKTFGEMITTIEDNNFQQLMIGLNGFYTQAYNTATFMQNNTSFLSMLTRFIGLNSEKDSSELSLNEINERYKLQQDIEGFIHKIVIQNRIRSLHYGKSENLLYKEIAIFMENRILSAESIVTNADVNIFSNTGKDDTINFLSYDQLKEYGIKLTEDPSRPNAIDIDENPPCILFNIISNSSKICSILVVLNNTYIEQNVYSSENIIVMNNEDNILFKGRNIDKYISDNFIDIDTSECENKNKLGINNKSMRNTIKESMLNIGDLRLYYNINTSSYKQIKVKQALYLMLSITMNLILIVLISQYQAKRIIEPVRELNKAISAFPEKDLGLENKDGISNKYKKTISLHERLIRYFIGTTVIPFILFICACYITSMIELKTYINSYSDNIVETEAKTISKTIERKEKSFFMFINEPYVLETMMHTNDRMKETRDALDRGVFMGIGKSRVMLMDASGEVVIYNNNTIIDDLNKKIEISGTKHSYESFLPIKWELERNLLEEFTLVLDAPVFYAEGTKDMKYVGTAAIFIDLWEIENIFYRLNTIFKKVYLVDNNGKVFDIYNKVYIAEDKNTAIKKLVLDNKYGMHVVKDIEGLDWQVISVFSKEYADSKTNLLKKDCIYCMFLVILLSIVYSFFISYQILKPINRLNYYINTVELDSACDINIDEFYIDEIDKIGKNFIVMTERIEQLIDELMLSQYNNLILDKEGKKAQIKALQAEITPHFLYNTLDIIINLIRDMKTEKAISMIQALSDLFRYSITDNEISSISIGEELKYAKSYTDILTVHYNEHVRFNWEIEPYVEQYKCMRMFLQPILENCVVHALNENDLEVTIKCKISGGDIIFIVQDNGEGIKETELEKLKNRVKAENRHDAHIGLNNVYSRLKLLYGELYSLNIDSKWGLGTTVTIKIPARMESKVEY